MFRDRVFTRIQGSWVESIELIEIEFDAGRPRRAAPTVRSEITVTFQDHSYVPRLQNIPSVQYDRWRRFNLKQVEEGADAGAEEEAVDHAPEQHAGAATEVIIKRRAEEIAGGVRDEEE